MTVRRRWPVSLVALAAALGLLGALAWRPLAAAPATPIPGPSGNVDLVLRIEAVGGYVPEDVLLRRVPAVSLYGDGRLIVANHPVANGEWLMPELRASRLSAAGVRRVLAEARRAGLADGDRVLDYPCVTDMPSTVFTVVDGGRTSRVSVYALGFDPLEDETRADRILGEIADAFGLGDDCGADEGARARALAFSAFVGDLPAALPPLAVVEGEGPYPIDRLQVVAWPVSPSEDGDASDDTFPDAWPAWPLDVPLDGLGAAYPALSGEGARCAVVPGDEAAPLLAELARSPGEDRWLSDGRGYAVVARPLLPDEAGCAPPWGG